MRAPLPVAWAAHGIKRIRHYGVLASACKPLSPSPTIRVGAVQSNKVYPPQEVSMASSNLASRLIDAIRRRKFHTASIPLIIVRARLSVA